MLGGTVFLVHYKLTVIKWEWYYSLSFLFAHSLYQSSFLHLPWSRREAFLFDFSFVFVWFCLVDFHLHILLLCHKKRSARGQIAASIVCSCRKLKRFRWKVNSTPGAEVTWPKESPSRFLSAHRGEIASLLTVFVIFFFARKCLILLP